jgi:hypothetical protein
VVVVGGGWLVADAGSLVVVVVGCGSLVLVDGRWLVAGGWLWLVFVGCWLAVDVTKREVESERCLWESGACLARCGERHV